MSQYPLEGTQSIPRRFSRAASPTSINQTAGVGYGSADMPLTQQVNSPGEQMTAQLESALSGLGGFVARAGAINQRSVDQQNALDEKAQNQREIIEQGMGAQAARRNFAGWAAKVEAKQIPVPLSHDNVTEMVDGIIRDDTKEMSPTEREAYRKSIEPALDKLIFGYRQQNVEEATKQTVGYAVAAASKETTAEGIQSVLDKLKGSDLGLDDDEISKVALNVLQTAAVSGNTEQFAAASTVLGDRFPEQRERAQNTLEVQIDKVRIKADRAFSNLAAELDLAHEPYDIQRKKLREFVAANPAVDSTTLRAQLDQINAAQRGAAEAERKRMAPLIYQQSVQALTIDTVNELNAGAMPGRGFAALRDSEVPDKDGNGVARVSVRQKADYARDYQFNRIDSIVPIDTNPQANLFSKMVWMGNTGDPDMRYDGLRRRANSTFGMLHPDMKESEVPQASVQGFVEYQDAKRINQTLAEAHLNEDTRAKMFMAEAYLAGGEGRTIQGALLAASGNANRPKEFQAKMISPSEALVSLNKLGLLNKDGTSVKFENVANGGAMIDIFRTLTLANRIAGNTTDFEAAKRAGEQFAQRFDDFGGYFVDKQAKPVVNQIDKIETPKAIIEYWLSTHPDEGPDASKNLGLMPTQTGWTLAYLQPYWEKPIDAFHISDADLAEIDFLRKNQTAIAEHPDQEKKYQAIAKSARTGGMYGAIGRVIGLPAIAGGTPLNATNTRPVPPLPRISEATPNNPELVGIYEFIKRRSVKPAPRPNRVPATAVPGEFNKGSRI